MFADMRRHIFLLVGGLLLYTSAMAQSNATTGLVFDRDILSAPSINSFAQRDYMGTARSMAMGGAFTSLGADMASLGVNPAGFGMYQHNDISVTFGLGVHRAKNSGVLGADNNLNSQTRFSVNNIGASFKVYEGTGDLLAINFAFGYNKVADYNYNLNYHGASGNASIADAFADIANRNGLGINSDNHICDQAGYADYDMNPYYWSTALAYKGRLINRVGNSWYPDEIGANASIDQFSRVKSRGSAGEFSLAVGFNVKNILYIGASLDIQSISRIQTIYYGENISYAEGAAPDPTAMPYQLREFTLAQQMRVSGTGVGAKFGVVVRPVKSLRIGFAVHTPTYYSVSYSYKGAIDSVCNSAGTNPENYNLVGGKLYASADTPELTDSGSYGWEFTTPTRLLAGISYTISKYAIISADYEYNAFRATRITAAPLNYDFINSDLKYGFRNQHIVRAGIEAKPLPIMALRVGGGYLWRVTNDKDPIFTEPVRNGGWYCSAGLGFRVSRVVSIDVAYQFRHNDYTKYDTYYSENDLGVNSSPIYGLDMDNHNVALTFGFRF